MTEAEAKAKAKAKKKKSEASEHNRLNCDLRSLIHFVLFTLLFFFFFCQHFSPSTPENMQKIDGVYVMDEQKLP